LFLHLLFYLTDKFIPLQIDCVLGVEKFPAFAVSGGFKGFYLLLALQLGLQGLGQGSGFAGLSNLLVDLLNLPLQTFLEVVAPAVEFNYFLAASTWCGFKSTRAFAIEREILPMLPDACLSVRA